MGRARIDQKASAPSTSEGTVFLIGTGETVWSSLRKDVESAGYHVGCFASLPAFLLACDRSSPGCVILVNTSNMDIIGSLTELKKEAVPMPVIVLSNQTDVQTAVQAMKLGTTDFLGSPYNQHALLESLRQAMTQTIQAHRTKSQTDEIAARLNFLTARQRQVVELIVAGYSTKQIAVKLQVTPKTVEYHRGNIMRRLGVGSLVELVRVVVKAGEGK